MLNRDSSKYVKVDNSVIEGLYNSKNGKRALFIYSYMSNIGLCGGAINTTLSQIIDLFDLKTTTGSKTSIGEAVSILVDMELFVLYEDRRMSKLSSIEDVIKKPKDTFWIKVNASESDKNYTLIPAKYINKIVQCASDKSVEDMFTILSYICLKVERRSLVSPVMWVGMNNISKDTHITGKKLKVVLDEMMEIKVIYYKKANMTNGKSGYIYGLYENQEWVDNSVAIAENNNKLDIRVKSISSADDAIVVIDDEFAMDDWLAKFFDKHGVECNDGIAKETNDFSSKFGYDKLTKILGDFNTEILNASNKNGAYRAILRRNM